MLEGFGVLEGGDEARRSSWFDEMDGDLLYASTRDDELDPRGSVHSGDIALARALGVDDTRRDHLDPRLLFELVHQNSGRFGQGGVFATAGSRHGGSIAD